MTALLCPNIDNTNNIAAAKQVLTHLNSLGVSCVADVAYKNALCSTDGVNFCDITLTDFDVIVAVGGDGTMLSSSQLAIDMSKPIFGVNSGRLGFLASFDLKDFESVTFDEINNMSVSERVLLDISLKSKPSVHYYAVNEVVVSKVNCAKTVEITVKYGDNSLGCLRCDGVIVSTPTGATGYSLSAGGPIVEPQLNAVVVTPICSHSLFSKSYVLADSKIISINPIDRIKNEVFVSIDGATIATIDHNDSVFAKKSEKILKLLTSEKRNFYDVLYNEISERR